MAAAAISRNEVPAAALRVVRAVLPCPLEAGGGETFSLPIGGGGLNTVGVSVRGEVALIGESAPRSEGIGTFFFV